VQTEGKGDSIGVTEETAAGGRRSLKVVDAAGLTHRFSPHFCYEPRHREGVTRAAFDVRLGSEAIVYHEWRTWGATPYRVGPSLWIQNGELSVAGKRLATLPLDTWIRVEVRAGVGSGADASWTLEVTLPGETPKRFEGLATGSPDFADLTWVGWVSNADRATVFYLDNIEVVPTR
jgi:hypothetical protein